jgi:hypothetical protein
MKRSSLGWGLVLVLVLVLALTASSRGESAFGGFPRAENKRGGK